MTASKVSEVDSTYAWLRLAAAVVLITVGCAGMYIAMVGVPAYQADFGVSRGHAALPFTLLMLGFGIGGILVGRMVDRFGIVLPLVCCAIALGTTFALASRTQSFWAFAVAHAALGAFGCAAVFSPLMADISAWFVKRRGFAIAICASGNYLAGTVWPPMVHWCIAQFGWRSTYDGFALLSVSAMLPLLLLLTRRPAGGPIEIDGGGSIASPESLGVSSNTLLMLLCLAGVGCCTAMAMPQAHAVALATDYGISGQDAAVLLSLMFGFGVVSRLFFGWISDRLGGLRTLLIGSLLQCIALSMFLPADSLSSLSVAASLFGLFQGGIVPTYALIVREYFPGARAGAVTGIVIFATLIGMSFGGWVAGLIYDYSGSYTLAFLNAIGWNLLNVGVMGFLVWRASRARHAYHT